MYRTAGFHARYVHGRCKFSDGDVTGHVWTQVKIGKKWVVGDATSYRNSLGKVKNWNTKHYTLHSKYASIPF
jgi:transglutaminase-like putative cysteine protease